MVALAATLAAASPGAANDWPPSADALADADVRAAIEVITTELLGRFDARHGWDPARWTESWGSRSQSGGFTALAALALVRAGVSVHDPRVAAAIDLVQRAELPGTYAVATRACLLTRLPPDRREGLALDVERLLRGFHLDVRGWNYRLEETWGRRDNSLRQFGALALWDASAAGVPVPDRAWVEIERAFLDAQRPDGGWNYAEDGAPARGSMTAAAVATLLVTDDRLGGLRGRAAAALAAERRAAIDRGIDWLDRRFDPARNPGSDKWWFYYAYSIERVGLATGRVRLAGLDWFRELAREALDRTCRRDRSGTLVLRRDRRNRVDDLAFALMLLSRGRVPVVAGKLVVPGADTDERPRDVAAVARIVGDALEQQVGWRRVGLEEPAEDWLSVPMLVLVGSEPLPAPDSAAGRILRDRTTALLDAGGWLLAIDTGSGRLGRGVADLVGDLRPRAQAVRAARDHPAFGFHRDPGRRLPVQVVSDGVRDLAVILRGDDWLPPPAASTDSRGRGGRARVAPHATVLLNLALAATADGPPRPRLAARPGDPRAAGRAVLEAAGRDPDEVSAAERPRVRLRRLRHGGHWDAVPGAETVFATWAEAAGIARVTLGPPVPLDAGGPDAPGPRDVVLVAGVEPPAAAEAGRIARASVAAARAGAQVLVTTGGGRPDGFSRAIEAALPAAGASAPSRAAAAALLADGPRPVASVRWTHALREVLGPRATEPRLRAARVPAADAAEGPAGEADDRGEGLVLVSHEDLLVGVLGRGAWGVRGHVPESARDVLAAVVAASGRMQPETAVEEDPAR